MAVIAEDGRLNTQALEVGDIFVKAYKASYGLMRHCDDWIAIREYQVDRILKRDIVCGEIGSPEKEPLRLNRSQLPRPNGPFGPQ